MALCGAKTRSGLPCKNRAMVNGRCRMHGGKATETHKGNQNARTHGIFSSLLSEEERGVWDQVQVDSVDDEIRMQTIRLIRAMKREIGEEELVLMDRSESPAVLFGVPDYENLVKSETFRLRDWGPVVDRIQARIESLKRTRLEILKNTPEGDDEIESVQVVIERRSARKRDADAE
ncbi:MAG: hypothetical protein KER_03075 [Kerstersia gyiorum]|uniref:HGGxSTG domain-containing protein n=1 Tax=Kerstersia gyiorum TaxID=206506 RepID=UPI0030CB96B5